MNLEKQQKQHSPRPAFKEDMDEDEDVNRPNITRTGKITVTANRRSSSSTVYSPSSSVRLPHRAQTPTSSRHLHSHSPFLTRLLQLRHNRTLIIICIVALIVVIGTQIIVNLG